MKSLSYIAVSVFLALALASAATAKDTKGTAQKTQTCKAKLADKHVKKADMKSEYEKCMNDPVDY